ncbi:MAG: SLC13 family permease [Myxococcota bacterium]|nr:SLC13 family permease [Myxococcota bacterium]
MQLTALLIFALTYVLITARRLRWLPIGRPAGALLGALLMVVFGVLSPKQSYEAIDHDTILLLFGMMLLTVYLERDGLFERLAALLLGVCRGPVHLLFLLCLMSGLLSALLMNDTICLFMTPLVVSMCMRAKLPMGPYLIGLASSANVGSAATLVGNPQNMIIGSMSELSFSRFAFYAAPIAALGLLLNFAFLWLQYRRRLQSPVSEGHASSRPSAGMAAVESSVPESERMQWPMKLERLALPAPSKLFWIDLALLALLLLLFFAGLHLAYTTLAVVTLRLLLDHKEPASAFAQLDWPLLVFFCGLFIAVHGLVSVGLVDALWAQLGGYLRLDQSSGVAAFSATMSVGSNLVSNVPMTLVTGPHLHELGGTERAWVLLAWTTTVAGNLTLMGSVANIIVAERAKGHYELGYFEYLRFGLWATPLLIAAGVLVLSWVH